MKSGDEVCPIHCVSRAGWTECVLSRRDHGVRYRDCVVDALVTSESTTSMKWADIGPVSQSIHHGSRRLHVRARGAALATLGPAWRATRVDPMVALRAE